MGKKSKKPDTNKIFIDKLLRAVKEKNVSVMHESVSSIFDSNEFEAGMTRLFREMKDVMLTEDLKNIVFSQAKEKWDQYGDRKERRIAIFRGLYRIRNGLQYDLGEIIQALDPRKEDMLILEQKGFIQVDLSEDTLDESKQYFHSLTPDQQAQVYFKEVKQYGPEQTQSQLGITSEQLREILSQQEINPALANKPFTIKLTSAQKNSGEPAGLETEPSSGGCSNLFQSAYSEQGDVACKQGGAASKQVNKMA